MLPKKKLMAHALSPSQLSIAKWSALVYLAVFVLQFYSLFLLSSSIQHSVCSATYIPIPKKRAFLFLHLIRLAVLSNSVLGWRDSTDNSNPYKLRTG